MFMQKRLPSKRPMPSHYLENRGLLGWEDLVHIYDTPSPTDKDPSLWVLELPSILFFYLLGDAGIWFDLFASLCSLVTNIQI